MRNQSCKKFLARDFVKMVQDPGNTPFEQISNEDICWVFYTKQLPLLNTKAEFFSSPGHYQWLSLKINFKGA
jgi:hypothetical protein